MAEEDMSKMTFHCPGFIGLFQWIVMTFGLKHADITYQRAINLIFHDLLGIMLEIYIDDVVVKSDSMDHHLGWFQWSPGCISLSPTHVSFLSLSPTTFPSASCSF
jgi:hypothetical protein